MPKNHQPQPNLPPLLSQRDRNTLTKNSLRFHLPPATCTTFMVLLLMLLSPTRSQPKSTLFHSRLLTHPFTQRAPSQLITTTPQLSSTPSVSKISQLLTKLVTLSVFTELPSVCTKTSVNSTSLYTGTAHGLYSLQRMHHSHQFHTVANAQPSRSTKPKFLLPSASGLVPTSVATTVLHLTSTPN